MAKQENYPTPGGVEKAIKEAARRAATLDPSLDVIGAGITGEVTTSEPA